MGLRHRKTKNFSLLLAGTLMLLVGFSCSKSQVEDKSELATTAAFDVTPVSAMTLNQVKGNANSLWSEIPHKNSITFHSCINDITLQISLQGERVSIKTPFGEYIRETNSQGCFTWDEDFTFSYISQQKIISYPVTITGRNGHTGSKSIDLVINPWSLDKSTAVYDPRFQELPMTEDLSLQKNVEAWDAFLIKNLSLNFLPSQYDKDTGTASYEFNLNAQAIGQRKDLQGDLENFILQKGHFQLKLSLIEERNQEFQKIAETFQEIKPTAGQIQETLKFHIKRGFQNHPDSTFYIKVELSPIGLRSSTYNGVNLTHKGIMPLAGLRGSSQGVLSSLENYPLGLSEAKLKSEIFLEKQEEENLVSEDQPDLAGEAQEDNYVLQIGSISLNQGLLIEDSENKLQSARLRRLPTEICLVDTLSDSSGRPLPQTKVRFNAYQNEFIHSDYKDTEEVREAVTNINGCFQSFMILTYDYLGCEKFHTLSYDVEVLEGRYQGAKTQGKVSVNPYISQDFFYDLNLAVRPPQTNCEAPKLSAQTFSYKTEGMNRDGFRVNKNLNLSLEKRYSFNFQPKFFRGNSYQEVTGHLPLYFGDFEMTFTVLSPTHADVNYYNVNPEEWVYITSSKGGYTTNQQGIVQGEFNLPLHLSETLSLSYKNLLLVEVTPKNLNLKPYKFSVPFYALAQGATLATQPQENFTFSYDVKKQRDIDLELGFKVPGVHNEIVNSLTPEETPLSLYRKELQRIGTKSHEKFRFLPLTRDNFNALPPVGRTNWDSVANNKVNTYKTQLSSSELRALSTNFGNVPKQYLRKFCRLFHLLPVENQRNTILFGETMPELGGENYEKCIQDPHSFIELTPMSFVQDILGSEKEVEIDNKNYNYIKARFKKDEEGKIQRGNAFFAAYGDRSSINWGERKAQGTERSFAYGSEAVGLSMLFVGGSESYTSSEEKYRVVNTAEMKAAFNRNYTSRDIIDLTYNSVTLGITIEKRDCITLTSKRAIPLAYQVCRNQPRKTSLEETWFLISDTNMEKHGIISDGNLVGDKNRSQVIRGQHNFNILWDQFEGNDTYLIVKEIGGKTEGDAYEKYLSRDTTFPFESQYDHSFPGMILPAGHTPTTSCNDCQGQ